MKVEWLQFLMLLELDIFIVGSIVLFVLWLVYHYAIRSGYASLTYQPTEFHESILARSTRIHGRYLGSPWLPSGDFLSILATFFRSHPHPYRREQLEADDGAMLNLDWLEPESTKESAPVLVVLPGITGHSKSGYLVHLVNGAFKHGWRVAVLVYPGTDLSKVKTARFIRGHVPHDLEIALDHIHARYPKSPMYAVGYSMGAALLTKYLAHHGKKSKIAAAISCSNPFDVLYSFKCISKGLVNKLYNMHFLSALKKMYLNNMQVFQEAFPHLTPEDVVAISSVEEYDSKLTMKHFGFEDLHEYYISLGCKDSVEDVSVPMLVAHARDDPIVPIDALPLNSLKANPNIITMITGMGGHTGWLQGLNPMGPSWFDEVALEWIFHVDDYLQDHKTIDNRIRLSPLTTTRLIGGAHAEAHSRKSLSTDNDFTYLIPNTTKESKAKLGAKSPSGAKSPKATSSRSPKAAAGPKSPTSSKSGTPKKNTKIPAASTPKSPKGRK